jgi:hypothetical protein
MFELGSYQYWCVVLKLLLVDDMRQWHHLQKAWWRESKSLHLLKVQASSLALHISLDRISMEVRVIL